MKKIALFAALSAFLLGGCATIVGDSTQVITIASTPGDASVLITDEKGLQIYRGQTPARVVLQKSDGSYMGKKSYSVQISKEGYETQVIPIFANVNGWYLGGNLVFGGLVGWLIVDPLTGAMYTLSPEHITTNLGEKASHTNDAADGSISVLLLQDVPPDLRNAIKRIN